MTMARIKAAFAAEESRKIGVRVRRKKVELAEQGKPSGGGIRAFGYNWPHRIKGTTDRYRRALTPMPSRTASTSLRPRPSGGPTSHLLDHDGTIQGVQREWTERGLATIRGRRSCGRHARLESSHHPSHPHGPLASQGYGRTIEQVVGKA